MTTSYPVLNLTRVCAATGRPLQSGEKYRSVLLDDDGKFVRKDYSAEGWPGPPEKAIAYWSGTVPDQIQKRRLTFDGDLLMECFGRLAEEADPEKVRFRYVVALLLLRRKQLQFENTRHDGDQDYLQLKCPKSGNLFEVLDPHLSDSDIARVQEDVVKLLGWE